MPGESRDPDTHDRIRHDRIDKAGSITLRRGGRMHHIGVGRTHAGTCVILLLQDLDIRIVNAITVSSYEGSPSTRTSTTSPPEPPKTHPK